jgi:hypothetical protein
MAVIFDDDVKQVDLAMLKLPFFIEYGARSKVQTDEIPFGAF